jgi:hypothetical protein
MKLFQNLNFEETSCACPAAFKKRGSIEPLVRGFSEGLLRAGNRKSQSKLTKFWNWLTIIKGLLFFNGYSSWSRKFAAGRI